MKLRSAALAAAVVAVPLALSPSASAAPAALSTAEAVPAPQPGFRVLPYLQDPRSDSMTLNWISELGDPGTVRVTGPGIGGGKGRGAGNVVTLTSTPEDRPLLDYTDKERAQSIEGLEQGSWLKADSNYKHSVTVDGLKAGKEYSYTVTQNGVEHRSSFRTAPDGENWNNLRIVAFADSETEPKGRVEHREWEINPVTGYAEGSLQRPGAGSLWDRTFGSATRYGEFTLRYPMSQDTAMKENMAVIEQADPDLMMIAGDITQGGGYQPGWDEFFGYVAGEHGDLASSVPFLTALGNWETYASINGGYGTPEDRTPAVVSRNKYLTYFDNAGDSQNPQHQGSYYRTDHGPVTVLTLDSTNGIPDENTRTGTLSNPVFSGDDTSLTADNLSTDTQGEFTAAEYASAYAELFPGTAAADLPSFNPGSAQWEWAERQLAEAREQGQIVVVQFHHAAYSNGVHGTPPNHEHADNQSGTAMRAYTPLFEKHGVATVVSGHDEMFERSFVDEDGDGLGFHSYDVGVAADGLRGEQLVETQDGSYAPLRFNTHSRWMAAADEPELWEKDENGVLQLTSGGLHYGHLQMDLERTACGAEMTLTPVHVFPVLDEDYDLERTERREYDDVVTVHLDAEGRVAAPTADCGRAG
ncbi:metallophosphoesterase family protein [Kocuria sp. M1R5S2]|uniref:metallophosphoesterase family protein n=1 Tax=Kocuria rhizosphaerae TaxID=3376285 RepID=UPI003795DAC9